MLKLYLVRHGETLWNRERRYQGQLDVGLSGEGRAQAAALARRLADVPFDGAWASDLSRCAETLRIILDGREVPTVLDPDLREAHLGEWQGQLIAEVQAARAAAAEAGAGRAGGAPGGETAAQLRDRITACIARLAVRHAEGHVLVVSHGGALRAYLCHVLGLPLRQRGRLRMDNACLSVVELHPEPRLVLLNDLRHLGGRFSATGAVTTA